MHCSVFSFYDSNLEVEEESRRVMDLVSMIINEKQPIEIVFRDNLYCNGIHEYQSKWDPFIDEILEARMEPANEIDKICSGRLQK